MIETINYKPNRNSEKLNTILKKTTNFTPELENSIRNIILNIKNQNNETVLTYTKQFDNVKLNKKKLLIPKQNITKTYENSNKTLIEKLSSTTKNIEQFHQTQIQNS